MIIIESIIVIIIYFAYFSPTLLIAYVILL